MKYEQLSIYDFLPEEKSQEVAPSETLPQVDEAQEDKAGIYKISDFVPSSALDARKGSVVEKDITSMIDAIMLPMQSMEGTDSTLFSVGDKARVKVPDFEDSESEDYYFLKALEGKHFKVLDIDSLHITCEASSVYDDKIYKFYHHEVIKI